MIIFSRRTFRSRNLQKYHPAKNTAYTVIHAHLTIHTHMDFLILYLRIAWW